MGDYPIPGLLGAMEVLHHKTTTSQSARMRTSSLDAVPLLAEQFHVRALTSGLCQFTAPEAGSLRHRSFRKEMTPLEFGLLLFLPPEGSLDHHADA